MTTPESSNADLDKILKRVRAMIAKAEKLTADAEVPGIDPVNAAAFRNEADAARTMADALMLQYAIDDVGKPPEQRTQKAISITVIVAKNSEIDGYVNRMLLALAHHCRCKVRQWSSWTIDGWNAKVYGMESDVRYFELLYTTTRLHMLGVLMPRYDRRKSLEENAWLMHNAGYNWLQIAEMDGWMSWRKDGTHLFPSLPPTGMKVPYWRQADGWQPATQVGSRIKRAYHRAAKERGESVQVIAANGTSHYRKSAADGYTSMIQRRLWRMQHDRPAGATLVLKSTAEDVDKLFRDDNPELFPSAEELAAAAEAAKNQKPQRERKVKFTPVNEDAWRRGSAHAETADLSGHARASAGHTPALGE